VPAHDYNFLGLRRFTRPIPKVTVEVTAPAAAHKTASDAIRDPGVAGSVLSGTIELAATVQPATSRSGSVHLD
jgi:hypothetical protein